MPRRLGQHFLIRDSILERIAAAACDVRAETVIEIGAGKGALTRHLLRRAGRVIAIELDFRLADHLRTKFAGEPRVEVVTADALEVNLAQWGRAVVAGNLPYYAATPLIERVLRLGDVVQRATFLVQKEVAERLTATPGHRDYGYLTVQTKLLADSEMLFTVDPAAFRPPPAVDSAVVRLTPKECRIADAPAFLRFVGACFRHKRKTIRNNLAPLYGMELVGGWPEAKLRAEQLPVERFTEMFRRVQAADGS